MDSNLKFETSYVSGTSITAYIYEPNDIRIQNLNWIISCTHDGSIYNDVQ